MDDTSLFIYPRPMTGHEGAFQLFRVESQEWVQYQANRSIMLDYLKLRTIANKMTLYVEQSWSSLVIAQEVSFLEYEHIFNLY